MESLERITYESSKEEDDYWYKITNVYLVAVNSLIFRVKEIVCHDNASEDEPAYDETVSECRCLNTDELIWENQASYDDSIIEYVMRH